LVQRVRQIPEPGNWEYFVSANVVRSTSAGYCQRFLNRLEVQLTVTPALHERRSLFLNGLGKPIDERLEQAIDGLR